MSEQTNSTQVRTLNVSTIKDLLSKGYDNKKIAEELNLSQADVRKIRRHPELRNRKVSKSEPFALVDDSGQTVDMNTLVAQPREKTATAATPVTGAANTSALQADQTNAEKPANTADNTGSFFSDTEETQQPEGDVFSRQR